jgi:S-adenosylmethionine/arginine decarboxylase-like enzyme
MPNSHHFIGVGPISEELLEGAQRPEALVSQVSDLIRGCGLGIVSEHSAGFEGGGATLVWILAESHLVVHLWVREGFATVDLHVCDFTASNAENSQQLKNQLSEFCFAGGQASWHEITLEQPQYALQS